MTMNMTQPRNIKPFWIAAGVVSSFVAGLLLPRDVDTTPVVSTGLTDSTANTQADHTAKAIQPPPEWRPVRIANQGMQSAAKAMVKQGFVKHAGNAKRPPKMPKLRLADLVEWMNQSIPDTPPFHDVLFVGLLNDDAKAESDALFPLSSVELWRTVGVGDVVLLTDSKSAHFTTVFDVDRRSDRILFADGWPSDMFLLPGHNLNGVEAELIPLNDYRSSPELSETSQTVFDWYDALTESAKNSPKPNALDEAAKQLISISRREFEDVVLGVICLCDTRFVDDVIQLNPAHRDRSRLWYAMGNALLLDPNDRFVNEATDALERAVKLTSASSDEAVLASRLSLRTYALTLSQYRLHGGLGDVPRPASQRRLQVAQKMLKKDSVYSAQQYHRLGIAAQKVQNYDAALEFFNAALGSDHPHDESYIPRAVVLGEQGEHAAAIEDASTYIERSCELMNLLATEVKSELEIYGSRAMYQVQIQDLRKLQLCHSRHKAHSIRRDLFAASGNHGKATAEQGMVRAFSESVDRIFQLGSIRRLSPELAKAVSTRPGESNSVGMDLRYIPPGRFLMGSHKNAEHGPDDETPQHDVIISKPFLIGACEVTRSEYRDVMGEKRVPPVVGNPKGAGVLPIANVSWFDAVEYCNTLSRSEKLQPAYEISSIRRNDTTGGILSARVQRQLGANGYRLPTEAEWEYACRAGNEKRWSFGDDPEYATEYSWYRDNTDTSMPQPVGTKKSNAFGIFDMHGNVREFCEDQYAETGYLRRSPIDPQGKVGTKRVTRGGAFIDPVERLRSAVRLPYSETGASHITGFRVVRVFTGSES